MNPSNSPILRDIYEEFNKLIPCTLTPLIETSANSSSSGALSMKPYLHMCKDQFNMHLFLQFIVASNDTHASLDVISAAREKLNSKYFGGIPVKCTFYPVELFQQNIFQ